MLTKWIAQHWDWEGPQLHTPPALMPTTSFLFSRCYRDTQSLHRVSFLQAKTQQPKVACGQTLKSGASFSQTYWLTCSAFFLLLFFPQYFCLWPISVWPQTNLRWWGAVSASLQHLSSASWKPTLLQAWPSPIYMLRSRAKAALSLKSPSSDDCLSICVQHSTATALTVLTVPYKAKKH